MDNGCISFNSSEELLEAYKLLPVIFNKFKFDIQQVYCNDELVQNKVNIDFPDDVKTESEVKLLGMLWDRNTDMLYNDKINLNPKAVTKRQILASIASQYDIFNFQCPMMNRARLFMQDLQYKKEIGWDDKISDVDINLWSNIVKQANSTEPIKVKRMVGKGDDEYRLICCTDASNSIYGIVMYIQNFRTNEISFLCSKNRLVDRKLRTIPELELSAVLYMAPNVGHGSWPVLSWTFFTCFEVPFIFI